jgi:hypothetical protein
MDPFVGRFLSRDPVWPQQGAARHPYAYASSDPADRIDPSGREDFGSALVVPAILGSLAGLTSAFSVHAIITRLEAKASAHVVGPFEPSNPPQGRSGKIADALQHCIASCYFTDDVAAWYANALGLANEYIIDTWVFGHAQPESEKQADLANNAVGRAIAETTGREDCPNSCADALIHGQLNTTEN